MPEENKTPEAIKLHEKRYKEVERIINTISRYHRIHFDASIKKYLMDKDGHVDMDKLENSDTLNEFANHLSDLYKKSTLEEAKSKLGKDSPLSAVLSEAIHGISAEDIANLVRENGPDYTHEKHVQTMGKYVQQNVAPKLISAAGAHIKENDISDIVNFIPGLNANPKIMTLGEAKGALLEYHGSGSIDVKKHERKRYWKKTD